MKPVPVTLRKGLSWLFWLYLMALVLITVIPTNGVNSVILSGSYTLSIRRDYLLHTLVYIPLPLLMIFSQQGRSEQPAIRSKRKLMVQVFLFSLIIAAAFELFQLLLYYRTFNINDLAGNVTGVLMGFMLVLLLK